MVDNQHKFIKGYRDLTEGEIKVINDLKEVGESLGAAIKILEDLKGSDKRCVALAKTNLQQGMMWAVRAIAKPDGF